MNIEQYAIPKISMLHNLSCLEMRFRLLCIDDLLHSSLNIFFRQYKLHNILEKENNQYRAIRHSENKYLHNLSCLETRFRLLCVDDLLHSSLNLVFRQHKLHNILEKENNQYRAICHSKNNYVT